jgi:hypothetical protein
MRRALLVAVIAITMFPLTPSQAQQAPSPAPTAPSAADLAIATERFPQRDSVRIVCWSISENTGPVSEIVVLETDAEGRAWPLWRSAMDSSYSPKIRFLPGATLHGLAVALVERQTGAGSSQLDVIGKLNGHIGRLQRFDGSEFEVRPLDGADRSSLIVHTDVSVLDVPEIYRWNGARLVIDSAAHPDFYRELLSEDQREIPSDSAAIVFVNLARIAALAGDRAAAIQILENALSAESSKGAAAEAGTLRLIDRELRALRPQEKRAR